MTYGIPKKKLEEFEKEINKANSRKELLNILKRLETFNKLYPSYEGKELLAVIHYKLGNLKEALEIVKSLNSIRAKLLEVTFRIAIGDLNKAYNILDEIYPFAKDETKKEVLGLKLFILYQTFNINELKKLVYKEGKEKLKDLLYSQDVYLADNIFELIEEYEEAEKKLKESLKLKKAYENIKNFLEKENIKPYKLIPLVKQDIETGEKDFFFYVISPYLNKEKEKEIIRKAYLNNKIKDKEIFFVRLMRPRNKGEWLVLSN
jgi:hypothetical protein